MTRPLTNESIDIFLNSSNHLERSKYNDEAGDWMNQNGVYGVEIHMNDTTLHYLAYKPVIIKEDQREYVEFYNGNRFMMPEIVKRLNHNINQIEFIDHRNYKIIMTPFTQQNWNQMKSIYFENDWDILSFIPTSDEELIAFLLKIADNA